MLFKNIPENFFTPLSSKNKSVYWDCIYILYSIMNSRLSFGIERELVIDELQDYFDDYGSDIVEDDITVAGSRDKANLFVRKLIEYGWLTSETTYSHVQLIHFNDYAVEIVKTLDRIVNNTKLEYQGYIYTIYTLIRSNSESKGILLNQIFENTDKLITGLKSLNSNIKKYIDELTKYSTVAEIMDILFNDYRANIIDKAYHRLKTSDNVSKFRPEIVEALEAYMKDEEFIKSAAKEISEIKELSSEDSMERVRDILRELVDAFHNMDFIIEEIDNKNSQYQRSAINRAKFLLSNSEDLSGQIKDILLYMSEEMAGSEISLNTIYSLDYVENLFKIYSQGFLDDASFYAPIEGKKDFKPEALIDITVDASRRKQKLDSMKNKLEDSMNPNNIEKYVREILGEKEVMLASAMPLNTIEDFIRIIYVRLYGQRKRVSYRIVNKDEVNIKGYKFKDFEIWRK
ncbi:Wadjet anti-phage system protein JetA family protein [Clostridium manihotivorum]|uniref:TIGR02677 family protein n=1 Tax=Clostridium manihotivorum TaxID=2320868 RepID=A0A410DX43_9CLOT|nr:Wadjet anti-phage system protein JetA family protein [Clostridium manihotivorum]QAA33590.1 hypothetical protein C1I91_19190 [Clostridium manihotivorum]